MSRPRRVPSTPVSALEHVLEGLGKSVTTGVEGAGREPEHAPSYLGEDTLTRP